MPWTLTPVKPNNFFGSKTMILNLLKLAGVAIGVMAVVLAIGYLYVMNEMRNKLKKDKGL